MLSQLGPDGVAPTSDRKLLHASANDLPNSSYVVVTLSTHDGKTLRSARAAEAEDSGSVIKGSEHGERRSSVPTGSTTTAK